MGIPGWFYRSVEVDCDVDVRPVHRRQECGQEGHHVAPLAAAGPV